MTTSTFRHTKDEHFLTTVQEIVNEDENYTDQEVILEKFREHLVTSVANPNKPASLDHEEKLREMQIEYPAFIPTDEEITETIEPTTKAEIEEALRSMQADSTPGLTGTTRNFFLWLLTVILKIFVEGYNDNISNHTGDPPFQWVKMRKIVFIPKTGKPMNKTDS